MIPLLKRPVPNGQFLSLDWWTCPYAEAAATGALPLRMEQCAVKLLRGPAPALQIDEGSKSSELGKRWTCPRCNRDIAGNILGKLATASTAHWTPEEAFLSVGVACGFPMTEGCPVSTSVFACWRSAISSTSSSSLRGRRIAAMQGALSRTIPHASELHSEVAALLLEQLTSSSRWSLPFLPEAR